MYETAHLPLDQRQLQRLFQGEAIRLKHADLCSMEGVPIALTKTQLARIAKAKAAGKGIQLKLSQAQIVAGDRVPVSGDHALHEQLHELHDYHELGQTIGHKYPHEQLHAIIQGVASTSNGAGLFAPGVSGGGLFLPGTQGGSLSEMTAFELDEYLEIVRKQVRRYVHDTMRVNSNVERALAVFDKDCEKLHRALEVEADELHSNEVR